MYFLLVYAKISLWHCGGVVTQRSAKPCTPVQFRSVPPIYRSRYGEFSRKSHDFGSIISLSPNGGIGIRVRLKIEWRNPYGFKSHFGHQQDDLKKRGHFLFKNKLDIMIIAIDDSGDPGLKMDKGSSSYFVIVAVVFLTDYDAESTALKIERFRQTLKWKNHHEFKFRKTSPEIRKAFLSEINSCNFVLSVAVVDKANTNVDIPSNRDASSLYNTVILRAISQVLDESTNARVLIDGEGGSSYKRNVKTFFRQNLPKNAIKQIRYRDSKNDVLIQLADMVAGSVNRSLTGDKEYLSVIKRHINFLTKT